MNWRRRLVYDFLSLSDVRQRQIASELGLICESDHRLSDQERRTAYFKRATRKRMEEKLRSAVAREKAEHGD